MITIIHGDDIALSRKHFQTLKDEAKNPVQFEGAMLSLTDLVQAVEGGGLFAQEQAIFIESILTKKKVSKESEMVINYLQKMPSHFSVFIWENKELTSSNLSAFKTAQIKVFKLPQTLFAFLDSLSPHNGEKSLRLFQQTRLFSEDEMIFFMLIRQFRILLALTDPNSDIEETRRIAPWQLGKLQNQAKAFSQQSLITIYKRLHEIDLGQKTGTLETPLSSAIDILLLSL